MQLSIFDILYVFIIGSAQTVYSYNVSEYCEIGCVNPVKVHGVCVNPEKKLIDNCPSDAKIIPLHDYQAEILNIHNERRNHLASGKDNLLPPAARMGEMFWDKALADLAEYSARRCLIADPYCYSTPECPEPGRSANNYKFPLTKVEYEQIVPARIHEWMDTSKFVTPKVVASFPENPKQHEDFFGRAISDRNNQVGCAASQWINSKKMEYFLLVCLYTTDVHADKRLYKIGYPGSRCLSGLSDNFTNLCSVNENYNYSEDATERKVLRKANRRATTKKAFNSPEGGLWTLMIK